ncbi:hypothetical protein YC2023_071597 [Brassica napus]
MNWSRSWSKVCDSDRIVPSPSRSASGPWCWVGRSVMFLFDYWLAGWPFISNPWCGSSLQLLVFNEEFLVSASHQLALTTSLPFVHTARRSYRLNDPVKCSDRGDVGGSPSATSREVNLRKDHCRTLETERPENDETSLSVGRFGWIVRIASGGTKSVKENATKQPAFANPETVFVRKQCCNVKSKTTLGNGYLGSRIDEERSEMRYLV